MVGYSLRLISEHFSPEGNFFACILSGWTSYSARNNIYHHHYHYTDDENDTDEEEEKEVDDNDSNNDLDGSNIIHNSNSTKNSMLEQDQESWLFRSFKTWSDKTSRVLDRRQTGPSLCVDNHYFLVTPQTWRRPCTSADQNAFKVLNRHTSPSQMLVGIHSGCLTEKKLALHKR